MADEIADNGTDPTEANAEDDAFTAPLDVAD